MGPCSAKEVLMAFWGSARNSLLKMMVSFVLVFILKTSLVLTDTSRKSATLVLRQYQ